MVSGENYYRELEPGLAELTLSARSASVAGCAQRLAPLFLRQVNGREAE